MRRLTPNITDQWLEAETSVGFRTFYALHVRHLKRIVVIHGAADLVLSKVAQTYRERNTALVRWHSVHDPDTYTGVVVPHLETAWISAETFRLFSLPPGIAVESVPAGPDLIRDPEIAECQNRVKKCLAGALCALGEYELATRGTATDTEPLLRQWAHDWLDHAGSGNVPHDLHYFGTPLTPRGPHTAFVADEFKRLDTTMHLRGGCSTTNSDVLRRFGEMALMKGYQVCFYHDAFHPSRVDHLIIPELNLGITNATPPHEIPGGSTVIPVDTRFGRRHNMAEAESWWLVYQKLYSHAWLLMEEIGRMKQAASPRADADIAQITAQCTA